MLISLKDLVEKYNLDIKGIIHIGGHFGQEYPIYKELGIKKMVFFEPLFGNFTVLKGNVNNDPNVILINKALGNETGKKEMFVETANNGQSSSLLEPKKHLEQYPGITFPYREIVDIDKLDNIQEIKDYPYNVINCDVQGYEKWVFLGAEKTLEHIDYIYTEVNRDELYKDCTQVEQLDEYLAKFGFYRVETNWEGGSWGDALYCKKKKINLITTFSKSDDDVRNEDYLYCLKKNFENTDIDKIVIFFENTSNKKLQILHEKKMEVVYLNFRPTFKTFMDYANENFKNEITIIANGDVYFGDNTLKKLHLIEYTDKMLFAITRYDEDVYHYHRLCGDALYGSHDAWIFYAPIDKFNNEVMLGVPGCDNFILQKAEESNFEVYNISSSIVLYHHHKSSAYKNYLDPNLWYCNKPEYKKDYYFRILNIDKVLQKYKIFKDINYYDINIKDTMTSAQFFKVNEKLLPFVLENDTKNEWFYVSSNFPLQYNLYLDFQQRFNKTNVSMLDINPATGYNGLVFAYGFNKTQGDRNYVFVDNAIENTSELIKESFDIYKQNIDDKFKYFIIKGNYFEEVISQYNQFKYDIIQINKYNFDNFVNDIINLKDLLNTGGYIILNNYDLSNKNLSPQIASIQHFFKNTYYMNSYNGIFILEL